jgi:hypothetical protein
MGGDGVELGVAGREVVLARRLAAAGPCRIRRGSDVLNLRDARRRAHVERKARKKAHGQT